MIQQYMRFLVFFVSPVIIATKQIQAKIKIKTKTKTKTKIKIKAKVIYQLFLYLSSSQRIKIFSDCKCGKLANGQLSCCAPDGDWEGKCGAPGKKTYTWQQGVNACDSECGAPCKNTGVNTCDFKI